MFSIEIHLFASILFSFAIEFVLSSTSILIEQLRQDRRIDIEENFSSKSIEYVRRGVSIDLICSFSSNFDDFDLFWIHNGTFIRSILSKKRHVEHRNYLQMKFRSEFRIENFDENQIGFYQCLITHEDVSIQRNYYLHLDSNDRFSKRRQTSSSSIIVYPKEISFEFDQNYPIDFRCETNVDECRTNWFDESFDKSNPIRNVSSIDQMGFYRCEICCSNQCQNYSSFVYPIKKDRR